MQHSSLFRPLLIITALLAAFPAWAYKITGQLIDTSGEPMIQASVRLLTPRDSAQVKGAVTNAEGRFTLASVKKGSYILEASYVGYNTYYSNIKVADADISLKTITLSESSIMLKETTVVGIKTPIKVMQDTVEYNADSYKTAPNAVVEDLLKRLPGVEVDSEGKITANGKEVSKILLNGKEFFADDPKVASKNLPVDMIEKLQVVDRKSDLARITGVDDGEEETVINLTVKKGMENGWVGNAEAGYGTDSRYRGSFLVNRFWNGNQLSFMGGGNNVNDPAFTDGTSGRFRRFGNSNGITSSKALGMNFNVGKEEIFRVGGNLLYSLTDRDTWQKSDRQYLFVDSTSYYNSQKGSRDKGHNFRADFRLQWKPDSFNTFEFMPNVSLNYNKSFSNDSSLTRAGNPSKSEVVRSINHDDTKGTSVEVGGRLIFNHQFRSKPGRAFSLFANYRMSNVREKSNSYSWNKFYLLNDSIGLADRFTDNHTWSNSIMARATWTEPIGDVKKGNFINFAYSIRYAWNNTDRLTYDHPVLFPDGWEGDPVVSQELVLNDELTNRFRNDYMNQDIRVGYKHVSKRANIDVGLSAVPQMSHSLNLTDSRKTIPRRWVWNFAPYLRYRFRQSKTISLNVDYRGRSSQPSMTQLQPVADMSDPLRIIIGNPDLKPTFTHFVGLRYSNFNAEAQRSIMTFGHVQMSQNSIISRQQFKQTGGSVTTFENVNGVWNAFLVNIFSMPLRNKAFTFNNHLMANYQRNVGYNNNQRNVSNRYNLREDFTFSWKPANTELSIRPNYSLIYVANSLKSGNSTVHGYGATFYATYYTPFGVSINTDLDYSATTGYSTGYDVNQWMWNANLSYSFLRNQAATVSLKVYDLLQQKSNISRNVTPNYIDDSRYNSLTRYFMVTFTYKFNTFGKGKEPTDRNERRFGPGGPGGPGGGPMGPPPGR